MIDIHTHLFNLKYLPISGIMQSRGVPPVLADAVAYLLLSAMKQNSLSMPFSNYSLGEINNYLKLNSTGEEILKMEEKELIDNIILRISLDDYENSLVQKALTHIEGESELDETNSAHLNQNLQSILSAGNLEQSSTIIEEMFKRLQRLFEYVINLMYKGINLMKWFRFLMRPQVIIYQELIATYGNKVTIFVHHLLDMENYFKGNSSFDYVSAQIPKMIALTEASDGKLISFIGFAPNRPDSLDVVKEALSAGAKGVKFYPPMGYKPKGNKEEEIDKRNREFFLHCIDKDIPVFTHCTPHGFEAIPKESGKNSAPTHWLKLFEASDMEHLRLCLGHAGGGHGWFAPNTSEGEKEWKASYASKVYQLCTQYPNVYCEVGFLSEIKKEEELHFFAKRLSLLFKDTTAKYSFADKIMYGSDWHLIINEGLDRNYLSRYEKLLELETLSPYRDKFFEGNARAYLNLGSPS